MTDGTEPWDVDVTSREAAAARRGHLSVKVYVGYLDEPSFKRAIDTRAAAPWTLAVNGIPVVSHERPVWTGSWLYLVLDEADAAAVALTGGLVRPETG